MAEHLARIIGTEEDRVNCPFYWKIGACRHGDQCSRSHYKPSASQTLILRHMYQNPPVAIAVAEGQQVSDELLDEAATHFESFYSEVFEELANYGELEDMVVCDNIGDHIIGNVYVKYAHEESAAKALLKLAGRYYSGKQIVAEYTPVTDFREARCRQFVDGQCRRGGYCNFMHIKHVPRAIKRKLTNEMFKDHSEYHSKKRSYHDSRRSSRSRGRYRSRSNHKYRDSRERDNRDNDQRRNNYSNSTRFNDSRKCDDNKRNSKDRDRNNSNSNVRQTSEDRRAMIAKWNEEREVHPNNNINNHENNHNDNHDTNHNNNSFDHEHPPQDF